MKKTVWKIVIIVLCVTLFVGNAVLVYRFGYYVRNYNAFLEKYGKYDLEWMEGKTIVEVVDRYGPLDYDCVYQRSLAYQYMGALLVLDVRRPEDGAWYVTSAYYASWDTTEFAPAKQLTLGMWAKGKTLKAVLEKAGQPKFYAGDNGVVYHLDGDYFFLKLILDGSVESEDSVVIDVEHIVVKYYFEEYPKEWSPVE